jgi:hypothetical protein
MSLSGVSVTFADGNLGVAVPGPGGAQAKIGVSLGGTELSPISLGNTTVVGTTLLGGPLCDAAAQLTSVAGVACVAVPCGIITAGAIKSLTGSAGAFTHIGTSVGVATATVAPHQTILVKTSTGGALGTAAFQFAVNGGAYGAPVLSTVTSWSYRVPGTFCVISFAATTYTLNDVYTLNTDGTKSVAGTNPASNLTPTSSPVDAYDVLLTITTAATGRAAMQFTYSLDGGAVTSAPISGAATYVIPNTGIVLAFTDAAYVVNDTFEAMCTPPATNNTQIGLAITALQASSLQYEGIHVVGTPTSAANAATLATAIDSSLVALATAQKYRFGIIESPGVTNTVDTDAIVAAAFLSFASIKGRLFVGLDWCDLVSPLTGLTLQRSVAWVLSPRLASSKLSESPGKVELGNLPNVRNIYRDEAATPGMADARFVCMRTREGKNGFYFEKHPTMASLGSDYSRIPNVRVINRASTIMVQGYTDEIGGDFRADKKTGFLDERDAQAIDNSVTGQLKAQLTGERNTKTDECSDVKSQVGRQDNLSSTETMTATVFVLPKNYVNYIAATIGFVNPALQQG